MAAWEWEEQRIGKRIEKRLRRETLLKFLPIPSYVYREKDPGIWFAGVTAHRENLAEIREWIAPHNKPTLLRPAKKRRSY